MNPTAENIKFAIGDSPSDVLSQMAHLGLPFKVLSIYAVGFKHIAWVELLPTQVQKQKPKDRP